MTPPKKNPQASTPTYLVYGPSVRYGGKQVRELVLNELWRGVIHGSLLSLLIS